MGFYDHLTAWPSEELSRQIRSVSDGDVRRVLNKHSLSSADMLCLLSPAAESHLEPMARKAHAMTISQFGRTMVLFTPLYLSNFCINGCRYCSFSNDNCIERRQLNYDEVEVEAQAIAASGLKHILILTGEAPAIASVEYIAGCCRVLGQYFTAIGLEVYALTEPEYRYLIQAGVDSLTIYQETYNESLYADLHPKGPKRDYQFRLDAPERACRAGMRAVNVGALLGLDDWRQEAFLTALHASYLQDRYPEAEIGVSLPRIRPHVGGFQPAFQVEDRHIVQIMAALRLFMPRLGITISTRESASFRDRLLPLGVTRMSAGSCTAVGGHTEGDKGTGQFEISDKRTVPEMAAMLCKSGWQPVYEDWQGVVWMKTPSDRLGHRRISPSLQAVASKTI